MVGFIDGEQELGRPEVSLAFAPKCMFILGDLRGSDML